MVLGDLDSYMQKKKKERKKRKKLDYQLNTIHKNKLKMYKRLNYKSKHHKHPRGEHKQENFRYTMQQYVYQHVP